MPNIPSPFNNTDEPEVIFRWFPKNVTSYTGKNGETYYRSERDGKTYWSSKKALQITVIDETYATECTEPDCSRKAS